MPVRARAGEAREAAVATETCSFLVPVGSRDVARQGQAAAVVFAPFFFFCPRCQLSFAVRQRGVSLGLSTCGW